jgi:hypothetical protein
VDDQYQVIAENIPEAEQREPRRSRGIVGEHRDPLWHLERISASVTSAPPFPADMDDSRILCDPLTVDLQLADLFQRPRGDSAPIPEVSLGDREVVGMPGVEYGRKEPCSIGDRDPDDDLIAIDLNNVAVDRQEVRSDRDREPVDDDHSAG